MGTRNKGKYDKTIVISVEKEVWMQLRLIAVEQETTMSDIIRACFKKIINNSQKKVDRDK